MESGLEVRLPALDSRQLVESPEAVVSRIRTQTNELARETELPVLAIGDSHRRSLGSAALSPCAIRTVGELQPLEYNGHMNLIKSKQRVADYGEVFTPPWLVDAMLDLVKGETERIDSRFLEPACGSGNFLVPVLQRKLAAVEIKFGNLEFERRHYALLALMCCYGIELLEDNIIECRSNMLEVLTGYLGLEESDDFHRAASYVLFQNLVHGDALMMRTSDAQAITFAEWGYLGKGRFQRRDFRLDALAQSSAFSEEDTLFADLARHDIFVPIKTYPPMTVSELAGVPAADDPAEVV